MANAKKTKLAMMGRERGGGGGRTGGREKKSEREGENKRKTSLGSHLHYIYWKPKALKWAIEFLSFLIVPFKYFTITIHLIISPDLVHYKYSLPLCVVIVHLN